MSSYAYTITGGTDGNGQASGTLNPSANPSVPVQISEPGGTAALTYTVTCGNLAASAPSESASSDVWQPTDEPTNDPTDGINPSTVRRTEHPLERGPVDTVG